MLKASQLSGFYCMSVSLYECYEYDFIYLQNRSEVIKTRGVVGEVKHYGGPALGLPIRESALDFRGQLRIIFTRVRTSGIS